jgi:5'-deoxynucleotidase YfbR-like HD superfamily hydrolase
MTWMQSAHGNAMSFLAPDCDSVHIEDICFHLAGMRRFNGACKWTVAAHSRLVHTIVKETVPTDYAAQLWAIMHDFHEAYTGDRTSPLQAAEQLLMPKGWVHPIKTIQENLDRAIARHFNVDWQDVLDAKLIVKRADLIACATEKEQFLVREPMSWGELPPPYDIELTIIGEAQNEWLLRREFERALELYRTKAAPIRMLEAAE